jgi:hypothetical protein
MCVHGRKFKKEYMKLFIKDPLSANVSLLLYELAGPDGKIVLPKEPEEMDREIANLIQERFQDPHGLQL